MASEANAQSEKTKKTTILPEHVVAALEARYLLCLQISLTFCNQELGFASIKPAVEHALGKWRETDKAEETKKREKKKSKTGGLSDEDAIKQQQALFAAAAAKCYS